MVMIVGHRGARNLWPENGLGGFRRTAALGVESVEFDVHATADGGVVVIHDPTMDRTTLGSGPVVRHTTAEVTATRLREDARERVPTLDEVLAVYAGTGIELQIEIKTDTVGDVYPGLERKVIDAVRGRGMERHVRLTSFMPHILETVRREWPEAPLVASVDRRSAEILGGMGAALDRFLAFGDICIAVEKAVLVHTLDLCLARTGRERLGAWVPNTPDEIAFWMGQPIRQVTTDRPDLALAARSGR
ncbi:MAG: glycerophosphodiester phosphodiesterase family protein [Alphaproteobacteria bacterium]